ncbi:MAG: hypothetical protein FJ304_09710 [Planctomycetes bacterium]|nr:hypothetical protein [Planctomycetota bacterium]
MVTRGKKAETAPGPRPARRALVALLTLAAVGGLVFGLWRLGDAARRNIGPRARYEGKFADIECPAPPGLARDTFLSEVRYAANAPPTFQALDPDLSTKLTAAFATHPWVQSVDAVTVDPDAVRVALTFRAPALAANGRAVDAKGVLLPLGAPTAGLPELLDAPALPPDAPAGKPWPNEAVARAAPVAAEYKAKTIARTAQGWELVMPDGKKLVVGR